MTELQIGVLLVSGVVCWMLGGSGFKFVRRFLWPVLCAGLLWWAGTHLLESLLTGLGLIIACSLHYGDRTPWPVKVVVFLALPMPALVVNLWVWPFCVLFGVLITGIAWLSHRYNFFTHKIFEAHAGLLQAGCIVIARLIPQ